VDQVDARFAGRYDWACFRPGNGSQKNHRYSRLYLNFKRPEDVVEFAEVFNGHVFVNEKGAQFKALVEYAPSQQVPKSNIKKDGRGGTIVKGARQALHLIVCLILLIHTIFVNSFFGIPRSGILRVS